MLSHWKRKIAGCDQRDIRTYLSAASSRALQPWRPLGLHLAAPAQRHCKPTGEIGQDTARLGTGIIAMTCSLATQF